LYLYTLFSLLFGIGFSIIISNAMRKHVNGFSIFYRRMAMLLLIGFYNNVPVMAFLL